MRGNYSAFTYTWGEAITVFSWHNKYKTLQIKKNSSTFKSKAMENFTKNTKKLSFRLTRKLLTVGQINVKTLQTKETYPSFRSNTTTITLQMSRNYLAFTWRSQGLYYLIELKNVRDGQTLQIKWNYSTFSSSKQNVVSEDRLDTEDMMGACDNIFNL